MHAAQHSLSKSRFMAGWQCPKNLWWRVNEPQAKELEPSVVLRDLFDQGQLVGERAREEWPNGRLIDGEYYDLSRITRTRDAIDRGEQVLFEACFASGGAFCAVDVLERNDDGWTLIEVKSASQVKDFHIPEVAFQVYVARECGVAVTRAEVMHLNREYRHPGVGPLFVRSDVTAEVESALPEVIATIPELIKTLKGPLPEHAVGEHCWFHDECAFFDRCWPDNPDHIRHLVGVGPKKTVAWLAKGVHTMSAIPANEKLNFKQQRQLKAQREKRTIVEPTLAEQLKAAMDADRLGFLDFETVMRALPAWNGLAPWGQTAAQYSYHERDRTGNVTHKDFLAEGPPDPSLPPDDPRETLALRMLRDTAEADVIVMYTPFERTQIRALARDLPHLAEELTALTEKLWDLNPVIANNVYDPEFLGSHSLKRVLKPLVKNLDYSDLIIVDGKTASVEIARLLFVSGRIPKHEREKTRRDLLAYCERDTLATVRLFEKLAELAI